MQSDGALTGGRSGDGCWPGIASSQADRRVDVTVIVTLRPRRLGCLCGSRIAAERPATQCKITGPVLARGRYYLAAVPLVGLASSSFR